MTQFKTKLISYVQPKQQLLRIIGTKQVHGCVLIDGYIAIMFRNNEIELYSILLCVQV